MNAVLPTGGHAKTYSATSIWDYMKRTSLAALDEQGYNSLKDPVVTISDYEGFSAHSNTIRQREFTSATKAAPIHAIVADDNKR